MAVEAVEPAGWEGDVVLRDGGTVHVRPIRPEDAERLVDLHGRLSAESIYLRFFSARPRLSAREVAHFTTVDGSARFALVALLGDDMVAVVRYDRWPGRTDAEVALVVDDAHQRRGIATVLLELLAAAAKERGIERFTASVLPSNRRMLSLFRSAGFERGRELADGVVEVVLALDPDASGEVRIEAREAVAEAASVRHLLCPRSVAVVGSREDGDGVAAALVASLVVGGFGGPVYPVVPGAAAVAGVPAWGSVLDLPEEVELAVLAGSEEDALGAVADCARRRVRGLLVVSPAAPDGGHALVAEARRNGMRVLGPGSLGVVSTDAAVRLHAALVPPPLPGAVALAAQSAALGLALLERAAGLGLGVAAFVDTGAKADVSGNDLLQYWAGDERTAVVLLELASFGNPRKFTRIVRRLAAQKPVVAVARVDEPGSADLFAQLGVIRVDWLQELLDVARVLLGGPLPAGRRVAVVGPVGTAALAGDACRAAGLEVGERRELPLAGAPAAYGKAVADAAGRVDAVLAVTPPGPAGAPVADAVRRTAAGVAAGVPVVLAFRPDDAASPAPAFTLVEPAARALGRVAAYAEWRQRPHGAEPALAVDVEGGRRVVAEALAGERGGAPVALDRAGMEVLLRAYGIGVAEGARVATAEEAAAFADHLDRPVAVKAGGLARRGRSEAAGVALDLQGADEVRAAFERMERALGPALHPAVVQEMVTPGVDLLVDLAPSPIFGAVLAVGPGGAGADARQAARRALPLTDLDATALVAGAPLAAVLRDGDGRPLADLDALADALLRLARLAGDLPEVRSVRANPLIAAPAGAVVVDVEVEVAPPPAPPVGGGRLR